jgi:thymidylate synthase (FAD)
MKTAEISVELVGSYGDDLLVANCARVSFSKWKDEFNGSDTAGSDARLIAYLARENHFMPFCHPHITFRIKAPLFVARQLAKHQIGLSWSEESRRYISSEPEFFFPDTWRGRPEGSIKQGSTGLVGTDAAFDATASLRDICEQAVFAYAEMMKDGVAPEQARMILPQNTMTNWIWSGSLMAFARVCNLRLDSHAQQETSDVAALIDMHMRQMFPVSWMELTK